jgi:predicted MFS family arabinose efflux permease
LPRKPPAAAALPPSERTIITLIGAIQFINVLDFMMVMPLGPDLAAAVGISASQLGLLSFSYAAAACCAGALGALFLDRFDRRSALAVALLGLVVGTAAGGLATGQWTMLLSRVIAGAFGGPATSLSIAVVADSVPVERRGRALGAVMGAFSVASVFGVPAGLFLARHGGWRVPFFAVAGLGVIVGAMAVFLLPPMRKHLSGRGGSESVSSDGVPLPEVAIAEIVRRPEVPVALMTVFLVMAASFAIVPNLAAYLQANCGLPRRDLEYLYALGGLFSFFSMRGVGRLVDRWGSPLMAGVGTLVLLGVQAAGFLTGRMLLPMGVFFVLYMVAQSTRSVAMSTVTTRVPRPHERARYQSLQSAVQHLGQGSGSLLGSFLLHELPDKRLGGMPRLTLAAMALALTLPPMLVWVQRRLAARTAAALAATG